MAIRVTVWNEYLHEVQFPEVAEVYPKGIHGCIADFLKEAGMDVKTATLREPEHGLTQEVVDDTDVLIWWGHMAHQEVSDEIVDGGLTPLHTVLQYGDNKLRGEKRECHWLK